jgi:hypothetical protein
MYCCVCSVLILYQVVYMINSDMNAYGAGRVS